MIFLLSHGLRSLVLIILSLAFLWSIPGTMGAPTLGNFVPKNFEVNAMAVSQHGDVAVGSFYAMDPTVIPWDLTKPIYKYTVVTLIVSNSNVTDLSSTVGINVPGTLPEILPFKVILIIQGVQVNAPAIVSDIESIFGMPTGSFVALTSNPVTLPVSAFGASISPGSQYPGFVNAFVKATSGKAAVIGKYSASLLETSSSAIIFNSIESLTYPVSPLFGASGASGLTSALFSTYFDDALGLNSTGVIVLHKNYFDFSQATDHTVSFNSFLGVPSITSATNETFATILPDGANVTSFSPSSMLVESSANGANLGQGIPGVTAVVGLFPWLGSAQRLLPDVTVSFHYPAFDSPVLSASETTTPSPYIVGQNFTLALTVTNNGKKDAKDLHFTLNFAGFVKSWDQLNPYVSQVSYNVTALAVGGTDTHNFHFLALLPEAPFTLSAVYLDSDSYAYTWHTAFSLAADVKTNGPLTVTKSVDALNPAYGQVGNVTVIIHNPSSSTYYNVIDTTPEALPFLYPGVGNSGQNNPCVYFSNYNIYANTTHFIFNVQNYCGPAILSKVFVKTPLNFQLAAQLNIPLSRGDQWGPQNPIRYPVGFTPTTNVTVVLDFGSFNQSAVFCCVAAGPLNFYYHEDPRTSYIFTKCTPSCTVTKSGNTVIQGLLVNAAGQPIPNAPVWLSATYYGLGGAPITNTLVNATTDSLGQFSYTWSFYSPNNPFSVGQVYLNTEYPGSTQYNSRIYNQQLTITITNPVTIAPGGSIGLSYPYWFNVTGPLTIEPERIIYSSQANITVTAQPPTTQPLLGEYVALSNSVTGVTVGPAPVLPVVGTTMDAMKVSYFYVAQNQTIVRVRLDVTNTGSQAASNVVVTGLIPRPSYYSYYATRWLPVVDTGSVTSVDSYRGTVSFSAGTLQPGQAASAWYAVKMNTTGVFVTSSNVTALGPNGTMYKFTYTGAVLAGYPAFTRPVSQPGSPPLFQQSLESFVTMDPTVIANGTSTTVTLHLFNEGNSTLSHINATLNNYYNGFGFAPKTFSPTFKLASDMPPWSSQTLTFTAIDHTTNDLVWTTQSSAISASISYNSGSSTYSSGSSSNLVIYNQKIPGFNPSARIDVSVGQTTVPAGTAVVAVVSITNTGSSNLTSISVNIQTTPELTYGSLNLHWDYIIKPGQAVKFRLGIQTRPGIVYPVLVSNAYYAYSQPGSNVPIVFTGSLSGNSGAVIRATDTIGPTISTPWTSPFAPAPSDNENVWAMMADPSAIGTADLDYSTNNKQSWTTIPLTSMIATYTSSVGAALVGQSALGDIFNASIPAQLNGTTVFYRIRATDFLGNPTIQDNNGIWYSYTVLGFNPSGGSVVIPLPVGNNVQVNVSQYIPTVKATITLNITTPGIQVQLTQLSSAGATSIHAPSTPTGQTSLGIYLQIQTSLPITGINAVIRIYYNSTQIQGLNATTIVPYHWETGTNSWVPLDNVQRNTNEMWVQGTASHFSLFAIFAASPAPPCTSNCTKPTPAQPPWLIIGIVVAVVLVAAVGGFYTTKMRKRGTSSTTETPASTLPSAPETSPAPASELSSDT